MENKNGIIALTDEKVPTIVAYSLDSEKIVIGNEARKTGWSGPPFQFDEERRFLIRCELDSAFFHLYLPVTESGEWSEIDDGTKDNFARIKAICPAPRDAVELIMTAFPIVRRKDEEMNQGEYRTKNLILSIYNEMVEAKRSGIPYQTRLNPSPIDLNYRKYLNQEASQINGQLYNLIDLLVKDPSGTTVHIKLPREMCVDGCNDNGIAKFRIWHNRLEKSKKDDVVIVRHPNLRKGNEKLSIAAGKILGIQAQHDPVNKQDITMLTLKTPGGLIYLKLTAEEWKNFHPLCILEIS